MQAYLEYQHARRSAGATRQRRKRAAYAPSRDHRVEHMAWVNMIHRCHNPAHDDYRYYGARGITVCEEWQQSFDAFFSDVGPRPSNRHTLDRIDNDGNYEPGNVRWATWSRRIMSRCDATRCDSPLLVSTQRIVLSDSFGTSPCSAEPCPAPQRTAVRCNAPQRPAPQLNVPLTLEVPCHASPNPKPAAP